MFCYLLLFSALNSKKIIIKNSSKMLKNNIKYTPIATILEYLGGEKFGFN